MERQQPAGGKDVKKLEKEIEKSAEKAGKLAKSGKYAEAATAYQETARLAETASDKRAVDFCLEEAKCNLKLGKDFNTGWSYKSAAFYAFSFSDFTNAINFAAKAIDYFTRAGSMYAVQWCYNLMGQAAEKMGDYGLAIKSYRKSLDIEYSEEIDKHIREIAKFSPHLTISHECGKDVVKEGEKIDVALTIKNDTKETMNDIKILGKKANELEAIASLKPGESKKFSYQLSACENAQPLFSKVEWKNARGERMESEIEPPMLCVIPNIEIRPYLKDKLEVGRKSYFVVSVANNSGQQIEDINLDISFPVELKVHPVSGYSIDKIGPGEERGFVFKILPTMTGKIKLNPSVSFRDSRGRNFIRSVEPFALEETLRMPRDSPIKTDNGNSGPIGKGDMDRLRYTEKFKRYIEALIKPKDMEESAYIKLTKQLRSATKGYTLKDVDMETVSNHVLEECRGFALAGERGSENYRLFMFSGESKEGSTYLLTVVIKEDDSLVHVAFKLYSDKDDELEEVLEKISDIAEYTIIAMSLATEIQKIEVKETINIIDSIVQRSKIGERIRKKDKSVDIQDSVVQRTDL